MNDDARSTIEEVERSLDLWRDKLHSLKQMFTDTDSKYHPTYPDILDELRLSVDKVRVRLSDVKVATQDQRDEKLHRLEEEFKNAREIFNVRLSTLNHQNF